MSKPIGKSSSVNPSGTNDAKTHGTSSKMGNLLAGMLEADPDFKKVVSRYMNRAGFDTTSSTAHPDVVAVRGPSTLENQKSKIEDPKSKTQNQIDLRGDGRASSQNARLTHLDLHGKTALDRPKSAAKKQAFLEPSGAFEDSDEETPLSQRKIGSKDGSAGISATNLLLPFCYVWKKTHKQLNKYFHILYGNGTKLISKLTTDGMPKLESGTQDAETFLSWCLDFRGWTVIQGITPYVIGPLPARPGATQIDERAAWDARVSEGLRYLCSAIQDNDVKANVASNAAHNGISNGPTGFEFLKDSLLQGTAEGPAIQQVLDGLRYKIDGSIVSFQSRFSKFANALNPRPAENILCQKYMIAISTETSAMFEAEISTTIATDDQTNFNRFAGKLTKLISQKSSRMTSQNPTPVGQNAQVKANYSTNQTDHDLLLKLQKQVEKLEKELRIRQGGTQNGTPGGQSKCDFKFPNGDICGGNHSRKNCWYENPSRCHNPDIRRSIERKIQEKSENPKEEKEEEHADEDDKYEMDEGEKALYASHMIGEDFAFCTEIMEKPLPLLSKAGSTDAMAESAYNHATSIGPKAGQIIDTPVKETGGGDHLIVDTGASNHIICDQRCILHPEKHIPVDITVKTANGSTKATSLGPASFIIQDSDGGKYNLTRNVIFCPEFKVNLFSPQREFKDFGTRILFDDACQLQLSDDTVVPFSNDNQVYKLAYTYPSTSSGVQACSTKATSARLPNIFTRPTIPAVFHNLREQLLGI